MDTFFDSLKLAWSKTNRWHRVILIFVIVELRVFPGGQLGFHCNDPSLSHPYTGDTITWKWLIGVCMLLPIAVMLITERVFHSEDKSRPRKRALRWYREYTYGLLINLTFVQLLKMLVGAPRPHFFDTCQPIEAKTCEESEYVSSYTCTKAHWLNQSDRSFPSGHTSLALHVGIFIVIYLHRRAHTKSPILKLTQASCIVSVLYCAISRMTDHRHHWWDVMTGAVIGAVVLLYTISSLCKNFQCLNTKRMEDNVEIYKLKNDIPTETSET